MKPVEWRKGTLRVLDQTQLPRRETYRICREADDVGDAIRRMAVRGAPVLGIAAAFGMALAARRSPAGATGALLRDLQRAGKRLIATRPTAVNIAWAVGRAQRRAELAAGHGADAVRAAVLDEAIRIQAEDERACAAMGDFGAALVPNRAKILTHCNTGMLCTAGWGTAQGVIYAAHRAGKKVHVWVDETRPMLQGARLTAWELQQLGVPMTLVADSAAASLMAAGRVDLVIVGADRIAGNGDVANKVGTYGLAVLARHHKIPFYVAAPISTIDLGTPDGSAIAIEERDPAEVLTILGTAVAPAGTPVANPAFDVTPARLVTAIVTEAGVVKSPYRRNLAKVAG